MTGGIAPTTHTDLCVIKLPRELAIKLRSIVNGYFYKSADDACEVIQIQNALNKALCADTFNNKGVVWEDPDHMTGVKGYKGP